MPFVHYDTQIKSRHAEKKISGVSLADANRELMTNVCKRSTQRWQKILLETGSVIRDKATYLRTGPPYALNEHDLQLIFEILEEDSTLMLDEISDILEDLTEKKPCISTLQSTITKRLNYSLKKGQTVDPRQSEEQRAEYARRVANLPSQYLVFLDEVGVNERDVVRTHLRAPVGQRGHRLRRKREGEHWTLCGAICEQGFLAGAVVEVGFDREGFETFLEFVLLPRMNRYPDINSVLIMDNAPIHKRGNIENLCWNAGVLLVYLPTFSPDKNPIEKAWWVMKAFLICSGDFKRALDKGRCLLKTCSELFTAEIMTSLIRGGGHQPA